MMRAGRVWIVMLSVLLWAVAAWADVALRIVVVNPSATETRDIPVRYTLPRGLTREDILSAAELKVNYDVREASFYVSGDIRLGPKETKTLRIVVRDIWKLKEEELRDLMRILDDKQASITDTAIKDIAQSMGDNIKQRLQQILEEEESTAADVEKRMELFSVHREKLELLKEEVFALDQMAKLATETPKEERAPVTLIVEAQNVLDKKVDVPVKYYLPKELFPEYILNAGGFEVKYDYEKSLYYLSQQQTFEPGETKQFEVKVENVWYVSEELIKGYLSEASNLNQQLAATAYAEIAQALYNEVERNVAKIIEAQHATMTIQERIATYRDNRRRADIVRESLEKMRQLLIEAQKSDDSDKVKNILREMSYLQKLKELSDMLFKDRLKRVAIWKVIMTIVVFLIVITTFFYAVWYLQLKKDEKRELKKIVPEAGGKKT